MYACAECKGEPVDEVALLLLAFPRIPGPPPILYLSRDAMSIIAFAGLVLPRFFFSGDFCLIFPSPSRVSPFFSIKDRVGWLLVSLDP